MGKKSTKKSTQPSTALKNGEGPSAPNSIPNPLQFMGITNPRLIGAYSGTKRDFQDELATPEGEFDLDINNYLETDPNSIYNDPDFRSEVDAMWDKNMKLAGEDFTKTTTIYWLAQSHIDIAWKWRLGQSIKKAQVTFGKAVRHMELYKNFSFCASQPALYEMVMHSQPELFAKIKQWVAEGRFELVGSCWTEPDPRMPSGECFVRQNLYGQRFFMRYFNKIAVISWFQDSFGYNIQMPQLSVRSGCKYFFTNKIANNRDTVFPAGAFHWYSPDGSHMLSFWSQGGFHIQPSWPKFKKSYRMLKDGKKLDFDYKMDKPEDLDVWNGYLPAVGAFYGKGDGGHGPTAEEWSWVRTWVALGKNCKATKAVEFYEALDKVADQLPNFHDELYYEFHRGTLTTHHLVKYMNRRQEWTLQGLENLAAVACITGGFRYPYERFTRMWKNACTLQMHDILPGSSVPEVYDDCYDLWTLFNDWTLNIKTDILESLRLTCKLENGNTGILGLNPLPIARSDLMEVSWPFVTTPPLLIRTADNNIYPIQLVEADNSAVEPFEWKYRRLIFPASFPSLGISTFELVSDPKLMPKTTVKVDQTPKNITMDNQYYTLVIDRATAAITSLKLKQNADHKPLAKLIETIAAPSNSLEGFVDILLSEPAWNINSTYRQNPLEPQDVKIESVELVESGPVRWVVLMKKTMKNEDFGSATWLQKIIMYQDIEGIDLDNDVDWHMNEITVKLFFTVAGNPTESIAEVSYGAIRRLLRPTANHDKPRWENNMQDFLCIPATDGSFCFNIVNEGKYGYDNIEGNKIGITMIRGPRYPDVPGSSWVTKERINRSKRGEGAPPESIDQGRHMIRLKIMPRAGSWEAQNIAPAAHAFNCPIVSGLVKYQPLNTNFIGTDSNDIEVMSLKLAEEGNEALESWDTPKGDLKTGMWVLRVYETQGKTQAATVKLPTSWKVTKVSPSDLLERTTSDKIEVKIDAAKVVESIRATWAPHEIKTFLLIR